MNWEPVPGGPAWHPPHAFPPAMRGYTCSTKYSLGVCSCGLLGSLELSPESLWQLATAAASAATVIEPTSSFCMEGNRMAYRLCSLSSDDGARPKQRGRRVRGHRTESPSVCCPACCTHIRSRQPWAAAPSAGQW